MYYGRITGKRGSRDPMDYSRVASFSLADNDPIVETVDFLELPATSEREARDHALRLVRGDDQSYTAK